MKKVVVIFLICVVNSAVAQYLDTLHDVFNHKSSIDARLETRYGLIDNEFTNVTGFRLGVAFQRKLRLGGGLSWLKSDYNKVVNDPETSVSTIKYLKFGYLCFYADFVFYKTVRWQLSVPIQAGGGLIWYQQRAYYNYRNGTQKSFLILYEPGITAQFKIFKWFGLGSDVAYRFTLKNNKKIGERLSSPMYCFKILIWFDQLFYELFPKHKLTLKKGPAVW